MVSSLDTSDRRIRKTAHGRFNPLVQTCLHDNDHVCTNAFGSTDVAQQAAKQLTNQIKRLSNHTQLQDHVDFISVRGKNSVRGEARTQPAVPACRPRKELCRSRRPPSSRQYPPRRPRILVFPDFRSPNDSCQSPLTRPSQRAPFAVFRISRSFFSPLTAAESVAMAPTVEQIVDDIKSSIQKLESRMSDLEARVEGKAAGIAAPSAMRMILMGPPGAGTSEHSIPTSAFVMPRHCSMGGRLSADKGIIEAPSQIAFLLTLCDNEQARALRLPASRTSTASATLYVSPACVISRAFSRGSELIGIF